MPIKRIQRIRCLISLRQELSRVCMKFIISPIAFLLAISLYGSVENDLFDLHAIRDASTLETKVLSDWQLSQQDASIRQKLIEITVCEWWTGQKVRIPVTLNVPVNGPPCRNVLLMNMGLNLKVATPNGVARTLLKEYGVGVVLVGMGTIEGMNPLGQLHLGMRQQLLDTKRVRYSAGWIWGMSQMRGLTAAIAESDYFRPEKVLATGGSKRGVGSIVAGIHDDRFTAILPVVAPPIGNPGGVFVQGTEPRSVIEADKRFYADLDAGKLGLDQSIKEALLDRAARWGNTRITVEQARGAGWSKKEIAQIENKVRDFARIVNYLPQVQERGLDYFFNVGTNDNVTPGLLELGKRFPDFPVYIVPGGQHGGPGTAGFTRRVTTLREVDDNLMSFARYHYFQDRRFLFPPKIETEWNAAARTLVVKARFEEGIEPEENQIWWAIDTSEPGTLASQYDTWEQAPLRSVGDGHYRAKLAFPKKPKRLDFVTVHTHIENGLPLTISGPYLRFPNH